MKTTKKCIGARRVAKKRFDDDDDDDDDDEQAINRDSIADTEGHKKILHLVQKSS